MESWETRRAFNGISSVSLFLKRFVVWDLFSLRNHPDEFCSFSPCKQVEDEENEADENDESEGDENLRLWEELHFHDFSIPTITWKWKKQGIKSHYKKFDSKKSSQRMDWGMTHKSHFMLYIFFGISVLSLGHKINRPIPEAGSALHGTTWALPCLGHGSRDWMDQTVNSQNHSSHVMKGAFFGQTFSWYGFHSTMKLRDVKFEY